MQTWQRSALDMSTNGFRVQLFGIVNWFLVRTRDCGNLDSDALACELSKILVFPFDGEIRELISTLEFSTLTLK
jgi:hypothetical protein